ncbi:E-selectin-like [Branchiostoma floridae x Branchiostoma japonicum]
MISADSGVFKFALFCVLLGVLIPNATGTGCTSRFPRGGLISSCKHADGRPYNVKELKSPQYADGSRCLFKCTGGSPVERKCQDGQWSGYEIECLTADVNIKAHTTAVAHHRSKRFWGIVAGIIGGALITCWFSCGGSSTTTVYVTRTDTYPPTISCPGNIAKTAERGKTSVRIDKSTWGHPIKAEDKNAEEKIVHPEALLVGLPPSSRFERGETALTYSYTDGGGNTARCQFTVTVTVPECPEIPYDQYGTFDCSGAEESYIHGSTCTLYCMTGYQASNPATVTCEGNGAWSGTIPECSIKSCSTAPSEPQHGSHVCSRDQEYNSLCTFSCDEGYTISGAHSQLCTTDGNNMIWVPNEAPTCQDTQPPQLTCPTGIETIRAAEGETTAVVTWDEPTATDNSGEEITPVQTTEIEKDKHHLSGYYDIRYKASDSSGQSSECVFGFRVEGRNKCDVLLPPPVVSCSLNQLYLPRGTFDCDDNQFIWGSTCSFQCSLGHKLTGQGDTECLETGLWQGDVPSCNALTCPAYPVPENGEGITGCTDAAFGQFCKISCNPGYDLQGASTARCIASEVGVDEGEWDQENASCIVRTCPAMYSPNHGSINDECDGQKVPFGTECHFSCDEGYWLTGQETNICSVEGRWEHPTPFCKAKTCHSSELPIPTNGVKSGCPNEEEYYGTTCALSCLTGYLPREHAQVTCENSEDPTQGAWDGDKFASCESGLNLCNLYNNYSK